MRMYKYIGGIALALSLGACSDKLMDRLNEDVNNAKDVPALNMLGTVIVESSFGTAGTDIAWCSSVLIEHNAGTFGQMRDLDKRVSATDAVILNNNWNAVYGNLMVLKDIIKKCSPDGSEPQNKVVLGIAQLLTAYNLAIVTDIWGQVPWVEALQGADLKQPKYDKQSFIYKDVIVKYINEAIVNLKVPIGKDEASKFASQDLIYGGNQTKWVKAAWGLKARYYLHMMKVVPGAMDTVLKCIPNSFAGTDEGFVFNKYEDTQIGAAPWYQFFNDRGLLGVSATLYDLMNARKDPRIPVYFTNDAGKVDPAPSGEAVESQKGSLYSVSNNSQDPLAPTPLMTYHELRFIEAEVLARTGKDFRPALKEAIGASFEFHKMTRAEADLYYTAEVLTRLGTTANDNLKEIMTQKYIAFFEGEAIEGYNDVRRTQIPAMRNPFNTNPVFGFPERFPYAQVEFTANPDNVPRINVYKSKIWWAGGTE